VPLRIYFTHGIAKMELGLGRGRRRFEKRDVIAAREHQREIERAMGTRRPDR
jgi:SsrA-binding protein